MIAIIFVAVLLGLSAIGVSWYLTFNSHNKRTRIIGPVIGCVIAGLIGLATAWFLTGTETGRALVKDTKSGIEGMSRTVRVYTARGDLIAEYNGQFNILDENGGIMFEIDGKRYIYWNCFVESIEN